MAQQYDYVELTREVVNDTTGETASKYSQDPGQPHEKSVTPDQDNDAAFRAH